MLRNQIVLILLILPAALNAQTRHTVSGTIRDSASGETLIGASVLLLEQPQTAVLSNAYGFYSINAAAGSYHLIVSFAGYRTDTIPISLQKDLALPVQMTNSGGALQEVVVTGNKHDNNV